MKFNGDAAMLTNEQRRQALREELAAMLSEDGQSSLDTIANGEGKLSSKEAEAALSQASDYIAQNGFDSVPQETLFHVFGYWNMNKQVYGDVIKKGHDWKPYITKDTWPQGLEYAKTHTLLKPDFSKKVFDHMTKSGENILTYGGFKDDDEAIDWAMQEAPEDIKFLGISPEDVDMEKLQDLFAEWLYMNDPDNRDYGDYGDGDQDTPQSLEYNHAIGEDDEQNLPDTFGAPIDPDDPIRPEDREEGARPMKVIRTSYEKWTHEDIEHGDTNDKGWIDEEGEPFNSVEEAIEWLREKGQYIQLEPSSGQFHSGIWYSLSDAEDDFEGGTTTNYAFHLDGFDEAEEEAVYNGVTNMSEKYNGSEMHQDKLEELKKGGQPLEEDIDEGEDINGTEMHEDKLEELKTDLEESVIGDHFHGPCGEPKPFPFTQDPTNSVNEAEKENYMDEEKAKTKDQNEKIGIEESALKGLRVEDVINRGNDFKTQWTVTKIDRNPVKVHLKSGMKTGAFNPMKEGFQYIDGVVLGYERTLEGVDASKAAWAAMEESINREDDEKTFAYIKESAKFEEETTEEVTEEELPVLTKENLYRFVKENEMHRGRRTETLQELVGRFGNTLEEMERILDDVVLSESDESVDGEYGLLESGELDTRFALESAWADMEEAFAIEDKGGNPRVDSSEEAMMKDMDGGDDCKININLNENHQWFNL